MLILFKSELLDYMVKLSENLSGRKEGINKFLVVLAIFLAIIGVFLYNKKGYVIIRFDELGPLTRNMSAYYNGFKIGRIVRIQPDKDFKHTLVKVDLNQKDLRLPQNTVVFVERFPNGELYLQFIYPQSPSLRMIKNGDILEGIAPYNLEQFMMGQSISGMSDLVSLHIIKALNGADAANQEMRVFFKVTSKLIKDNGKGISETVNNAAAMTYSLAEMAEYLKLASQNLNQTTKKINDALDTEVLKTSTLNIKDATSNVKITTDNIAKATTDIDKTVKKIDDTISNFNTAAQNLNSITVGINGSLSRRFGGMRVLFGSSVKAKNAKVIGSNN